MDFIPQPQNDDRLHRSQREARSEARILDRGVVFMLTANDFRRLGVEPHETRQTVIRQAAVKRTKTLARRQLAAPSTRTERQLTEVATSTYRLLDPRNRFDSGQRAIIGRILPNALQVAGRTRFANGNHGHSEANRIGDREKRGTASGSVVDATSAFDSAVPQTGRQLDKPWSRSLDERDLLERRWLSLHGFRKQLHQPSILLSLIAVLIGASALAWKLNQETFNRSAQRESATALTPSLEAAPPVAKADALLETAEPRAAAEAEIAASDPFTKSESTDMSQGSPIDSPQVTAPSIAANSFSDGEESAAVTPLEPIQITDVDDTMSPVSDIEAIIALELLMEQLNSLAEFQPHSLPEPEPIPEPAPERMPLAVPAKDLVSEARDQLEDLVPALTRNRSPKTADLILAALDEVGQSVDAGTIDDWTLRIAKAECKWLVGDLSNVQQELVPLTQFFEVELDDLLAATFLSMPGPIDSVEVHTALMENGFQLADRLLVHQKHAGCQRVLAALRYSANFLNDAVYLSQLDSFRQSAAAAARLHDTAVRLIGQSINDANASQSGIVGRYLCLMLRQWETGLPWLVEGSDRRLAALAKDELAINADPDLGIRVELAGRWLAAADRSKRREADSMRLHAIELLRQADQSQRGIRQLTARRLIDETSAKLPNFLRSQLSEEAKQQATAKAGGPAAAAESASVPAQAGKLSGRILGDAIDVGARVEYEPGVAIEAEIFEQIAAKLDREISTWSLELAGRFELKAAEEIQIHFGETTSGMIQEIWLDDQLVSFGVDASPIEVRAEKGSHAIRWVVMAAEFKTAFLAVQSAATGEAINIQPLPARAGVGGQSQLKIKIQPSDR